MIRIGSEKERQERECDESRSRVRTRLGRQRLAENREASGNGILRRQCWWAAGWRRGQKAAWADGEEKLGEREERSETEADCECLAWMVSRLGSSRWPSSEQPEGSGDAVHGMAVWESREWSRVW